MTAKIKLNAASGGGSISIQAPSSSSNNRVISLPDIADGTLVTSQSTLDATKLSGALPAISGANLTGISAGITMADQWRTYNTQSISGNTATNITSWERNDNQFAGIGSAMTNSGAIFTFPTTGIYLVTYNLIFWDTGGDNRYIAGRMLMNDIYVSQPLTSLKHISGETFSHVGSNVMLDVTNTAHELRFSVVSEGTFQIAGNNWAGVGNENVNTCDVTFIRLGDT